MTSQTVGRTELCAIGKVLQSWQMIVGRWLGKGDERKREEKGRLSVDLSPFEECCFHVAL